MPVRGRSFHTRSRSLSDPLAKALLPPENETPDARELRIRREQEAKKVSDDIDEQIRQDRVALRKQKQAIKILLLGQSESGKSTTLKRESFFLSQPPNNLPFFAQCTISFVSFAMYLPPTDIDVHLVQNSSSSILRPRSTRNASPGAPSST